MLFFFIFIIPAFFENVDACHMSADCAACIAKDCIWCTLSMGQCGEIDGGLHNICPHVATLIEETANCPTPLPPTLEPTPSPLTLSPSRNPTLEPTPLPSSSPILEPTSFPPSSPTLEPTPLPSSSPTPFPSSTTKVRNVQKSLLSANSESPTWWVIVVFMSFNVICCYFIVLGAVFYVANRRHQQQQQTQTQKYELTQIAAAAPPPSPSIPEDPGESEARKRRIVAGEQWAEYATISIVETGDGGYIRPEPPQSYSSTEYEKIQPRTDEFGYGAVPLEREIQTEPSGLKRGSRSNRRKKNPVYATIEI